MAVDVRMVEHCSSLWNSVITACQDCLVYMEDGIAELLHWSGHVVDFVKIAKNIQNLDSPMNGQKGEKRVVFILSSLLRGQVIEKIQHIIENSYFHHCTLFCTISNECQTIGLKQDSQLEKNVYDEFKEAAKFWMNNKFAIVEISHVPLSIANVVPGLFITPLFSSFFPILPSDLRNIKDWAKSQLLASSLSELFDGLHLSEDCYAIGHTAKLLASEVAKFSALKQRRNTNEPCTVIFVDRTLDLVQASSQTSGNLADQVMEALSKIPGHTTDVSVNMAPLFHPDNEKTPTIMVPGSLAHNPSTGESQKILSSLITKTSQECLREIHESLLHILKTESIPVPDGHCTEGKITAVKLLALVKLFRNNLDLFIKHSAVIQLAMAVINTLQNEHRDHQQEIQGTEKVMQSSLNEDDAPSCLSQISTILKNIREGTRSFSFEDVLLLLVYVHSLVGQECYHSPNELGKLQKSIIDDVLSGKLKVKSKLVLDMSKDKENMVRSKIEQCFERLSTLKDLRNDLKTFKDVYTSNETPEIRDYEPLLKQIVGKVFDPKKPEVKDIEFLSTSLKDYIKSGFSLFMNVRKQHPSDHNILFLFVVGGITFSEVQFIERFVKSQNIKNKIILVGTRILNSKDTIRCFFGQDNIFPDTGDR